VSKKEPRFIYLVNMEFFAGIKMETIIKGDSIKDVMKHPDIVDKIDVTDEINIKRIGG
jgi:hypothetical protein